MFATSLGWMESSLRIGPDEGRAVTNPLWGKLLRLKLQSRGRQCASPRPPCDHSPPSGILPRNTYLSISYPGRDHRLTDVFGNVVILREGNEETKVEVPGRV